MGDHSPVPALVIVVDGIIGSGKTTIIRNCLVPLLTQRGWRVTEVREPVDKWLENGRLQQFYQDPDRRGFQFQVRAFHDRVRESQIKFRQYASSTDIFLLERSIFTDRIFIKMLLEAGTIDLTEYEDYSDLWTMWEEVMPFKPDLFIYLKPTLEACMSRLRERARDGEAGVSEEYQRGLADKHDEFLGNEYVAISDCHYIPRILLDTDSNFRDDPEVQARVVASIETELHRIRNNRASVKLNPPAAVRAE